LWISYFFDDITTILGFKNLAFVDSPSKICHTQYMEILSRKCLKFLLGFVSFRVVSSPGPGGAFTAADDPKRIREVSSCRRLEH
jgi:hypothetical protein